MKKVLIPCFYGIKFYVKQEIPEEALTTVEAFKAHVKDYIDVSRIEDVLDHMNGMEELGIDFSLIDTKEDLDKFVCED